MRRRETPAPVDFTLEVTTSWSFPERGNWATHNADYRGNFAPQIARNIIEMYSAEGDNVLDQMVGAGTTLIEAKLLHRNAIGVDINPKAVALANKALEFPLESSAKQKASATPERCVIPPRQHVYRTPSTAYGSGHFRFPYQFSTDCSSSPICDHETSQNIKQRGSE